MSNKKIPVQIPYCVFSTKSGHAAKGPVGQVTHINPDATRKTWTKV